MVKQSDDFPVFEAVVSDNESNPPSPPKKLKQNWREILMLSFTSLGAIYGDIGTSPLYVLNSIKYKNNPPDQDDLYGAISIIFYIFTIIVICKYVLLVLWLGPNNGEGGQVAIYAKIARYLHIGPKHVVIPGSQEVSDLALISKTNTLSSFLSYNSQKLKYHPKIIAIIKWCILTLCFLGCSLVISDGLLTPTTSVLSAIGGIQIAKPSFNSVLAVSEVILLALFLIQQFGSHRISFTFAPIIFIWLIGLFSCGVYNIVMHHPQIFKALSPYYAIKLLKNGGIDVFSGAMLSITGTEAMFADIGHFGKLPIQLTLSFFVYPSLIICYLGQGAYLVRNPADYTNPFFYSLPGGANSPVFWIMFVLSTLATIIASQALILSVFSIVSQLINLDCFPKLKIVHTSKNYVGKVYIPLVNWMLMIGVLAATGGFKNSNNVTAAYGLGISIDFLVTTCLLAIAMIYVFNFNIIFPIIFILIFIPLEASLVIANLKKVPHGAWFTLMITFTFFIFLSIWRWGRSAKISQEVKTRIKVTDVFPNLKQKPQAVELDLNNNDNANADVASIDSETNKNADLSDELIVNSYYGTTTLTRNDGIAMMYNDAANFNLNSPNTLPMIYTKIIKEFSSLPSVFIFVTFKTLSIPLVPNEERVLIASTKIPGHYKCIIRFGFMDEITIDKVLNDHILNSIAEVDELRQKFGSNDQIPLMHIYEDNWIKCHDYSHPDYKTKNPFIWIFRICRKHLINQFFSPLHAVTQNSYGLFKLDNEMDHTEKQMFVGSIVRI
jgi:KUP system potassium uptake protein